MPVAVSARSPIRLYITGPVRNKVAHGLEMKEAVVVARAKAMGAIDAWSRDLFFFCGYIRGVATRSFL